MRWLLPLGALLALGIMSAWMDRHPTPFLQLQNPLPQKAPYIPAELQPNRAAQIKVATLRPPHSPADPISGQPQEASPGLASNTTKDSDAGADDSTEFWVVLGHKMKITDSLLVLVTLLLAIATAALIGVGWWQGNNLRRHVNAIQAEFAATHRPEIRVKHIWLEDIRGKDPVKATVLIVNKGRSVAIMSCLYIGVTITKTGAWLPIPVPKPHERPMNMSELRSGITMEMALPNIREALNENEIEHIVSGANKPYCFGQIEYGDAAKPPGLRTTAFCRRLEILHPGTEEEVMLLRVYKDSNYEYED